MLRQPSTSTLFPYTTLFRSRTGSEAEKWSPQTRETADHSMPYITARAMFDGTVTNESFAPQMYRDPRILAFMQKIKVRSEEHTSELQSLRHLVCRLLLEKKK